MPKYAQGCSKRPCPVCGVSYVMPNTATMCPECEARGGRPAVTFDTYQVRTARTNRYPRRSAFYDLVMGVCSEAGEIAGLVKKHDRDVKAVQLDEVERRHLALEIGDVMWYCSELAKFTGFTLEQIVRMNIDKLASRAERGRIGGSGDDR